MTGLDRPRAYGILILRVMTGIVFLWAGLAKVFAAEPFSAAGFLKHGTSGTLGWPFAVIEEGANPTAGFWAGLAANGTLLSIINVLVVYGEIAIGIALILGVATRFAGAMGFVMMALFSVAAWDFAHGLFNETVILGITSLALGVMRAGEVYGLDAIVEDQPLVRRTPALRYVLG